MFPLLHIPPHFSIKRISYVKLTNDNNTIPTLLLKHHKTNEKENNYDKISNKSRHAIYCILCFK